MGAAAPPQVSQDPHGCYRATHGCCRTPQMSQAPIGAVRPLEVSQDPHGIHRTTYGCCRTP